MKWSSIIKFRYRHQSNGSILKLSTQLWFQIINQVLRHQNREKTEFNTRQLSPPIKTWRQSQHSNPTHDSNSVTMNRAFPSYQVSLFQNESECNTFYIKTILIYTKMNLQGELVFIWMVSHENLFWQRQKGKSKMTYFATFNYLRNMNNDTHHIHFPRWTFWLI